MPRKYPFNLSAGDKCEIKFEVVADKMAEFKFMKGKREIKPNNKVSDICMYECMYIISLKPKTHSWVGGILGVL